MGGMVHAEEARTLRVKRSGAATRSAACVTQALTGPAAMPPARVLSVELGSKRLELLRDLESEIASVGLLVNPRNPNAAPPTKEMEKETKTLGLRLDTLEAGAESHF